ncbi:Presequence translocated-associated motor subunit PAM17, mitochondrial [Mariannaea sp. PMI_226]|nr:Presequence translocated-associated motor subunit PAM17, mitochondrial [Mariannaea sp. PMI_226]
MALPIKTFVLRYPCQAAAAAVATGRAPGFVAGVPKVSSSFSTVAAARPLSCLSSRLAGRPQCFTPAVPTTSTRASSTHVSPREAPSAPLDWNTFFDLRTKRRRVQMVFSVASGLGTGFVGSGALLAGAGEAMTEHIPLDPIVTLGFATLAFTALGWLIGPTIGSYFFWLRYHKWKTQMTIKEAEFFTRIKKHRVDPSNSSTSNPVPDFYGEKIQSVAGYRRWLKDQKAFDKKKRADFV